MRVLVLGGYGFIGLEIVRALRGAGLEVVALGRSIAKGRRAAPDTAWIGADISKLQTAAAWDAHLSGIDAVVNASGALQDGGRDDLAAVQDRAIRALIVACERTGVRRLVQISAPGASPSASTAFLRTKGMADAALRASALQWTIFKPGLVIGANAYGGTSLLRQLAAFPLVQPLALADRRMQTVWIGDVAEAVHVALTAPVSGDFDLVEPQAHTLHDIVAQMRRWLGYPPAPVLHMPRWLAGALARLGDVAGWLGWRPTLRTTALRVLDDDVLGDPEPWRAHGGALSSLEETLGRLPATAQERAYARVQLLLPLLIVTLALFWCVSGVVALWRTESAAAHLVGTALEPVARPLTVGGALIDMVIGAAVCVRPWLQPAALAAIAVSLGYLALATVFAPQLWADPLGPLVKVAPAMVLAATVAALAGER